MSRRSADRFLTEVEQAAVLGGPDAERAERFLRIWTLKEAVLKAMGTGIAGTLAAASIELEPRGGSAPVCAEAGWFLAEFRPTPQHRLAVAARADGVPPRIELCGIGGD
jgi:4'-phosphopantetheinyl transferase